MIFGTTINDIGTINPLTPKSAKKNAKYYFVKYWKTVNGTMQKYCQKGFIWMVTP